jgi:hypothetical protein
LDPDKKINEQAMINFYRDTCDKNNGHTFIWSSPQHRKLQAFTL